MAIAGTIADKTLVTGSAGYIGAHLKKNLPFIGLDSRSAIEEEKLHLQDFDPKSSRYAQVRTVVHLADLKLHEISKENLQENIESHRLFISRLSELPRLEKVIFSSSCSVYGASEELISEGSPVFPTSHYADSKLATEEAFKNSGIPTAIFRFGTAHGWSEQMRDDLFINQLARAAALAENVEIYSPEAWRPYVHCRDFALCLATAIQKFAAGTQNIVSENLTKRQILESSILKEKIQYKVSGRPDPRNYRIQQRSEWSKAPTLLEQSLTEMIEKYAHGKN